MTNGHLRTTAYHEAGHAVAAWKLGLQVRTIAIDINDDDSAGRCEIQTNQDSLSQIQRLAVCLAGIEAQTIFKCEKTNPNAWMSDMAMAIEIIGEDVDERESSALLKVGYERARLLITENTARLTRLASHLIEHRRIEYGQFLEVMNQP